MESLVHFSEWIQGEGVRLASQWWSVVRPSAHEIYGLSATIVAMPLAVGLLMRSLAGFLAAVLFVVVALSATAAPFPPDTMRIIAGGAVASLVLFCVSGTLMLWRQRRLLLTLRRLRSEHAEVRSQLDREIQWRMAAEPATARTP